MKTDKPESFSSSFVVMPREANHYGNVHGGVIMQAVDNLAYTLASRYCRMNVVTAKVREMDFLAPVKVGDIVLMSGQITRVGRSSMDLEISIQGEDLKTGRRFDVATSCMTMVAVDDQGKPSPINQ